ncbi:MAG TPA: DUF6713 family protein [Hymenobacter sp.]|jgi:hypothetical protein
MPEHSFFYLGLALLLVHEMDAVRCREWRIFPGLSGLSERWGKPVFMLVHGPLYFVLLVLANGPGCPGFIHGFSIFCLVHAGLHLLFLRHPKNEFTDWLSWSIIAGAAVAGALELVLG